MTPHPELDTPENRIEIHLAAASLEWFVAIRRLTRREINETRGPDRRRRLVLGIEQLQAHCGMAYGYLAATAGSIGYSPSAVMRLTDCKSETAPQTQAGNWPLEPAGDEW